MILSAELILYSSDLCQWNNLSCHSVTGSASQSPTTVPLTFYQQQDTMLGLTLSAPPKKKKTYCQVRHKSKLEQLERLRSEDTPRRLMITHTIESCWVPNQNKVEWPWRYRSRSKVITCDTPSHASDHLCQIWKESIRNCRYYRADTIFKAKAKWPWRYRSRSKVIICNTPPYTSDHLC